MNSYEQIIRNHLKNLTLEELYDSTYLYGIDFDKVSIENIMEAIYALYSDVKSLSSLVDRNFQQEEGKHVLLPKDRDTQNLVIQSCYQKQSVLNKILNNKYVNNIFESYKNFRKAEEDQSVNL